MLISGAGRIGDRDETESLTVKFDIDVDSCLFLNKIMRCDISFAPSSETPGQHHQTADSCPNFGLAHRKSGGSAFPGHDTNHVFFLLWRRARHAEHLQNRSISHVSPLSQHFHTASSSHLFWLSIFTVNRSKQSSNLDFRQDVYIRDWC